MKAEVVLRWLLMMMLMLMTMLMMMKTLMAVLAVAAVAGVIPWEWREGDPGRGMAEMMMLEHRSSRRRMLHPCRERRMIPPPSEREASIADRRS